MNILLGILTIILGLIYYFTEWNSHYKVVVTKSTGVFVSFIGFIFLIHGLVSNYKSTKMCKIPEWLVCTGCSTVYPRNDTYIKICPLCNENLIELNQYLIMHPKNRDQVKQKIINWPNY